MGIPYTKTSSSLTLIVGFRPTVIPSSHPNFAELSRLAANPHTTESQIVPLLDIPTAISNYTGGDITVRGSQLFYRGVEVKDNLAKIIMGFVKSGQPEAAEPFKRFLANCRNNPDIALVPTIYDWVVNSNMPITPDGELIAWKIVRSDYMSKRAGKRGHLDHSIGATVTEPREECNTNRNQTCSTGIHFCSLEYIEKGNYGSINGGDRIVAVVINPRDITAIPTDYNLSKGRCCELRVVGEVDRQDKIRGFYDGSGRVYGGWSTPAPTASVQLPVREGDRVVLRDGRRGTVTSADGNLAGINGRNGLFYLKNGMPWGNGSRQSDDDVVETVVRAPVARITPRTERNTYGFAVGQVWNARNGEKRTIASISAVGEYPIRDTNGRVYTANGRFNSPTSLSQLDLTVLVKEA